MNLNFRLVLALLLCSFAFALLGCGGSSDEEEERTSSIQPVSCAASAASSVGCAK